MPMPTLVLSDLNTEAWTPVPECPSAMHGVQDVPH
jgi:hypothetical protein